MRRWEGIDNDGQILQYSSLKLLQSKQNVWNKLLSATNSANFVHKWDDAVHID